MWPFAFSRLGQHSIPPAMVVDPIMEGNYKNGHYWWDGIVPCIGNRDIAHLQ